MTASRRWPGWVYDSGEDPDYRFSFANERTFLAWLRTALALIAGGVAVDAVELPLNDTAQHVIATLLILLGAISAASAWVRWARAERAMRTREPLPSPVLTAVLTISMAAVGLTLLLLSQ